MADTLIKLKTGTIDKLAQKNANNTPVVPLDKGTVYFAIDTNKHVGKIVYDAPDGTNGVDRIVMSSQSEKADEAVHATNADIASILAVSRSIDGIKFDGSIDIAHYGTCGTAAGTAAKVVDCNGFTLTTGAWIAVRFTVTNTAATNSLTLNVGGTGAKGIKYRNADLPLPSDLAANRTYLFVYDGIYYQWVGDRDTDTNVDTTYDPVQPNGSAGLMSGADKAKLDNIAEFADNVSFTRSLSSGTKIGTITINGTNTDLYSTNNTWTAFKGATASAAGTAGYINAVPAAGETGKYFGSDGAWHGNADSSTTGLMSSAYASKLDGIAEFAEVNQNTFANVKIGSTTIAADTKQDTLELVGSNVTLTPDATNDKVTIGITKANVTTALGYTPPTTNTTYGLASSDADGLMPKEAYDKLQNIADFAKNTTISATSPIVASADTGAVFLTHATSGPSTSGNTSKGDTSNQTPTWGGTFKVTSGTVDKFGHTTAFAEHTVTIPSNTATTAANGLMSSSDKTKFENGITIAGNNLKMGSSITAETLRTSLGLSSAMHFIGIATVAITDGSTTDPVITGYSTKVAGDVVIDKDSSREYVWSTSGKWEELGPDGSYALSNHTHSNATSNAAGFMSAADKAKLDGISDGAKSGTVTSVATGIGLTGGSITTSGTIKAKLRSETALTNDSVAATERAGRIYPVVADKSGYLAVNVPWDNTTYGAATSSTNGLMSAGDKAKLDGVESNAQVNVIEIVKMNGTALSVSSKAVNIPVMGAATSSTAGTAGIVPAPDSGKQTSFLRGDGTWVVPTDTKYNNATSNAAGLMSAADKAKLDGIATGAKTGTVTSVATGAGLVGGTITTSGTLKANLKSEEKLDIDSIAAVTAGTASRVYPVLLDKTGYLSVNVPWSNTTYGAATVNTAGLMSAADKTKLDNIADNAKNTTISASAPLAASASTGAVTISHNSSGVSANTYGTISSDDITPGFGTNFLVPTFTVNATGHITAASVHNVKIPATAATQAAAGLMSATDKAKLDNIAENAKTGTVTSVATGIGLTGGTITTSGTVKVKLRSETALTLDSAASGNTSNRVYAVAADKSGYLAVTVPWTNDWRPIADNLTSTSTTTSLSANQGRLLANGSARDSTKLPTAGGTMTGDITFTDTTFSSNPTDSKGLVWSGGTDGAKIFYRQTASNAGSLVLQLSDDGDEYINFRHTQGGQIYLAPNTRLFYPDVNDKGSIGTSSYKWNAMYATTFYGALSGNASSASSAPWSGITGKPSTFTPSSHTHGNISNDGTITSTGVAIASGDYLLISDNSNSGKIERTSITFDGSTATKALTQKGTWETFNNYSHPTYTSASAAAVKIGRDETGHVVIGGAITASDVGAATSGHNHDSVYAKKSDLNTLVAATDAMVFKGTIGTSGTVTALPASHTVGDTYRVITAGSYAGVNCEVGDLILCIKTGTASANADWTVAQTNIDGAVIGPSSSTNGNIALFDGTSGKLIKNSSYSPSSFASSGHTHTTSLASGGTATVNLAANTAYTLTAGGTSVVFKTPVDNNTTYSAGTALSLSGTTFNHSNYVTAGTVSEGGSSRTLAFGGTFKVPSVTYNAQGHITGTSTVTLTLPANPNTDTKNTTGSTDTSSKIFLVGATSQAANPQTYSDNQVYATNGQLDANKVRVAEAVTMQYNSTTQSLDFIFA